jgi:DNA polymerase I-like protein with 3'-5' exonuclease and polymerase domains
LQTGHLEEYERLVKSDDYCSARRKDAKTVWYGAQYRKSGRGFGFTLLDINGQPIGEVAGQDVLDAFLEEAPALSKWYNFTDEWLSSHTYMPSPGGRLRDFADDLSNSRVTGKRDWKFRAAGRKAGNHPLQALCAELKMAALWEILNSRDLKHLGAVAEVEIHDEIHMRCPDDRRIAEEVNAITGECMEVVCRRLGLPAKTDGGIGYSWTEAK